MSQQQFHMEWLDKAKTIFLVTYSGKMVADEYLRVFAEASRQIAQVNHMVDIIVDLSGVTYIDAPGFVKHASDFNFVTAPNSHLIVAVGLNAAARAVINTVACLVPRLVSTIRQAKSLEEAREIIENYRAQALPIVREMTRKHG